MAKITNLEILKMALYRFLRTAGALVLAILIPALVDLLPNLELSSTVKGIVTFALIPLLTATDKYLREKQVY